MIDTSRDLSRLLRPRSIAVIGGGVWCANVVAACRNIGFAGDIWPVNPGRETVGGARAVVSVTDLPDAPDASFVGVNRHATLDVVAALAARGAGGAICFAAGFSEAAGELEDGHDLQQALVVAAGEMPVIGPNCYGLLNYLDRVAIWPDQHGGQPTDRGVAIVAQSSNIAINLTMQRRGLPIAYVLTVGNQAQTGLSDLGRAALQDPRVTALGLHIEGIDDLRGFEALAAEAHALGKPIVALRMGRSPEARSALLSHTASLVGSDAAARALLARLGVGEVDTLSGFLEALKLFHVKGPLGSRDVVSFSCSGGEASLVVDTAHGLDLAFPPLGSAQRARLRSVLGPGVALANPLDYQTHIWGDIDAMREVFISGVAGTEATGLIVLDFPRADRCDPAAWMPVLAAAEQAAAASERPFVIASTLVDTMPEEVALRCLEAGLVPLNGLPEALRALDLAVGGRHERPPPLLLPQASAGPREALTEYAAKTALAAFGLPVPEGRSVRGVEAACEAATALGFPVVLKAQGMAHKTEAGGVALNLCSVEQVRSAAEAMAGERYLVERMVSDAIAELLVGVMRDPASGYVLTLAAGGTLTEILQDSASLMIPAREADVEGALGKLRIAPLLAGYRGAPAVDREALVKAVMGVQAYVEAMRPEEVEINPLICTADGVWVADALIVRGGGENV
ncbi:MAG: acetate--CoA ligase family protein [Pseudomonadota bacterium]